MRCASRLDAFSVYHIRTRLPGYALGSTTDAPEVRSTRSSRTNIEVPNLPVDVNSWGRSACYPQGSFYPLSDGISTHYHLITNSDFRLCSTCLSHSQAGLYVYTHCAISVRTEPTFERLRYSFGGDRPSQTAHLTLSPARIHGRRLETQ